MVGYFSLGLLEAFFVIIERAGETVEYIVLMRAVLFVAIKGNHLIYMEILLLNYAIMQCNNAI